MQRRKKEEIVLVFQEFPPPLQPKEWCMAKSKMLYKRKAFPCAF